MAAAQGAVDGESRTVGTNGAPWLGEREIHVGFRVMGVDGRNGASVFQKQIAFGSKGYPFRSEFYEGVARYEKGMCPVVERWYEKEFISHDMMRPGMSTKDLDDVITAFHKVYEHRAELA